MVALGYYVPLDRPNIDIQFFNQFEGYIWVFPRKDHLSVGICGKGESAQALRARLESWMRLRGSADRGLHLLRPRAALARAAGLAIPIGWRAKGWMALGDAGGLVDPLTGEGLYYAMRSADLATRLLLADAHSPVEQPMAYRTLLQHDFTLDLELAARLAKRLFLGKFLYSNVPERMIQFMRRSPTFCIIMQDLFAGTQNYLELEGSPRAQHEGHVRGDSHESLPAAAGAETQPGMKTSNSEALFGRAQEVIPGGVNSPVRAFRGVGGTPRFIARGEGSRLIDADGNSYIDFVNSWGPLLLGHRHPGGHRSAARRSSTRSGPASARPPNARSNSRKRSAPPCRRWRWSGWSTPEPKRP